MYDREWKEVLDYVQDLNDENINENIIDIMKEKLDAEYKSTYEEWRSDEFDVNHSFLFRNGYVGGKCTLLHVSALHGAVTVVEALLKNGANVNSVDEEYITPLHCAAGNGHTDIVRILLQQKGIKVNAVDVDGETPLHCAARFGSKDAIEVLLKKGAKINTIDKEQITPLHLAARSNHKNVIKFLLQKGADTSLQDNRNRVPKDSILDEEIKQLFEDAEERQLLKSKMIVSITVSLVTIIFETAIIVWFSKEEDINTGRIAVVLTVVTVVALVAGIGTYMKLSQVLSAKPSTEIDRAQAERGGRYDAGVIVW